jgi:hypothetical protein
MAHYCSALCQQQLSAIHAIECKALGQMQAISDKARVNVDLCRVALRILVTRKHPPPLVPFIPSTTAAADPKQVAADSKQQSGAAGAGGAEANTFQAEWVDVQAMASHADSFSGEDLIYTLNAAKLITDLLPPEYAMDPKELVEFMSRVNSNCHCKLHCTAALSCPLLLSLICMFVFCSVEFGAGSKHHLWPGPFSTLRSVVCGPTYLWLGL